VTTTADTWSAGQPRSLNRSDKKFGRALQELMNRKSITYRELAKTTGLTAGYLNRIVHGKRSAPRPEIIEAMAASLNVDPAYFREYRLQRVHAVLRERPETVGVLFSELALADPGASPAIYSDDRFGKAIELLLESLDISYRELAERTGLSAGYLNHIVHGNRPVPERLLLAQIAEAVGAEPDFFFDYRLVKVVEALNERPDIVNSLFARLRDHGGAPRSGEESLDSGAKTTVETSNEFPLTSEKTHERDDELLQVCVVPGCPLPGKHRLGVRCRVWHEPSPIAGKSKTSALWAPDSDAFLCDQHALGGAHITLIFEPNGSGETAVRVIAAPYSDDRRTPIRHEPRASSAREPPHQIHEPPNYGEEPRFNPQRSRDD
jgi:transcriptional regulator with XRE-family HTH domain